MVVQESAPMAQLTSTASNPTTTVNVQYLHKDHLGSVVAVSQAGIGSGNGLGSTTASPSSTASNPAGSPARGSIIERYSYNTWGQRRNPDGSAYTPNKGHLLAATDRGYTGHEHLDHLGLVHMNGRIYDPAIGRFLSADPFIGEPFNLQNHNRYAYVNNNPLSYTDPSGYFLKKLFKNEVFRTALTIAVAYVTAGVVNPALVNLGASQFVATIGTGLASGFTAGFVGSGGDIKAALNGAANAALFAYAGTFGGDTVAGSWSAARFAAHATAGCISGELAGGSCGSGAASALAGKLATNLSEGQSIFVAMAAGGTASVVTGGKFTNGAMTAGFAYVFNECAHTRMCGSNSTSVRVTGNSVLGDLAHAEIEITGGYDFVVLEARPGLNGKLVDTSNGPNWGAAFSYELVPPVGETTSSIALKLQAAASLYKNDLSYGFPSPRYSFGRLEGSGYNSNSYVGGLIDRALPSRGVRENIQAAARLNGFRVPGMEKPIPLGGR